MRDTDYATEIATADINGCRIERIYVKEQSQEEIRFSWWPDGHMKIRPLDMPESELLPLIEQAIDKGVFSAEFQRGLLKVLAEHAQFPTKNKNG